MAPAAHNSRHPASGAGKMTGLISRLAASFLTDAAYETVQVRDCSAGECPFRPEESREMGESA